MAAAAAAVHLRRSLLAMMRMRNIGIIKLHTALEEKTHNLTKALKRGLDPDGRLPSSDSFGDLPSDRFDERYPSPLIAQNRARGS